jgi:predicted ArsR family transcriptional regulator
MEIDAPRVVVFAEVARHPTKIAVLLRLEEVGKASPSGMASDLAQTIGVTSHHVNNLEEIGAVEQVEVVPVRGAAEHFYSLTTMGRNALSAMRFITAPWPEPGEGDQGPTGP